MHGRSVCLALVLLWPLASAAGDIDAPELGVRLTGLPHGAATTQVTEQPGGRELTTRVGKALLSRYREGRPEHFAERSPSPDREWGREPRLPRNARREVRRFLSERRLGRTRRPDRP